MNLYLIDGNSYVYRAFYAIRNLATSKGIPTNAIFGFTTMLLKVIREKRPDGIAVLFDSAAPTERHRIYLDYKAHRPETPSDLIPQLPRIREMISAFRIKIFELPGYEADDLIGTVAKKAASGGADVFIVTADKDMLQLVNDHIKVYDPMKDRVLDAAYVREKFGVGPERVTEFMALTGDAVDNIPGIKGVGEKTARELLGRVESLEELLSHPERIQKERLRKLVEDNRETVILSRKLATIDTEVEIEISPGDFSLGEPDWRTLLTLFKEFEFTSLMKLIPAATPRERAYETISSADRLTEVAISLAGGFALGAEATGRNPFSDDLVGIAFCVDPGKGFYLPLGHSEGPQVSKEEARKVLGPVLGDEGIAKTGHNLKYDMMLLRKEGLEIKGKLFDTMLASYLLNPNRQNHALDEVSLEYLMRRKTALVEVLKKRKTFAEVPIGEATSYSAEGAALSLELKEVLFPRLAEAGAENIYFDIEMPLIDVLVEMEDAGIRIDTDLLLSFSREIAAEIESIQKRIYFLAGEEFNINSPKQLSAVLFHRLGLSPSKKTKTGFSTGFDVLEDLASHHDLPKEVLLYRSLSKLKSTYLDVLPELVNQETGRVHTTFNQTVTATGRLSSTDPNLQNIPIRGDWGKRIRQAFVAQEGNLLLSADYSQVELRILAHLSGDAGLIQAFKDEIDIHARTASELFGVPLDRVTPEMRRTAKTVNFGVLYGISSFGLSETLDIDRKEAEQYIRRYFDRHHGVREYIERLLADARRKGYVETIFGRRRPLPELTSQNKNTRQLGERLAVNSPIQGTAADIIKIAMINVRNRFKREALRGRMILQVHDELLFELPEGELQTVKEIVREEMEGAARLTVPIKVEIGSGKNWSEAH